MTVQDRLRATTEEIGKIMYPVRPLTLPAIAAPARPRRVPGRDAWPSWFLPATAAVAVIAVAVSLILVRDIPGARHGQQSAPLSLNFGALTPAKPMAVPRYAAMLVPEGLGKPRELVVTDTRTGRAVASQKPLPGTTFSGVAGAPDDRTFVVDQIPFGQRGGTGAHAWYLLRFTPGSPGTVKRTGLGSLTEPASTQTLGFAVSPNGRMLAVLSQPGAGATLGPVTLQISSLVSGLPFTWTSPKPGSGGLFDLDNLATISWLSDNRRLAFQSAYLPRPRTIFLLDTFGHGHALFGDSKAVFTMPRSEATCLDALLAPDGRTAFCAGASSPGSHPGEVAITAYSTATGKPQRVLYRARMGAGELFWAGSRAQAIVLMLGHPSAKNPKQLTNVIGVITPGKFAPFPIAMGTAGYSYGLIAF